MSRKKQSINKIDLALLEHGESWRVRSSSCVLIVTDVYHFDFSFAIPDTLWFVHICLLLISASGRETAIADCLLFALSVPGDLFLLFFFVCVASCQCLPLARLCASTKGRW